MTSTLPAENHAIDRSQGQHPSRTPGATPLPRDPLRNAAHALRAALRHDQTNPRSPCKAISWLAGGAVIAIAVKPTRRLAARRTRRPSPEPNEPERGCQIKALGCG